MCFLGLGLCDVCIEFLEKRRKDSERYLVFIYLISVILKVRFCKVVVFLVWGCVGFNKFILGVDILVRVGARNFFR